MVDIYSLNKIRKGEDVERWTVEEVAKWLNARGFSDLPEIFTDKMVDGELLLQLSEKDLVGYLGVKSGILRKRLWRDIRRLVKTLDYSGSEGNSTAMFLKNINDDLAAYTYKLVSRGITDDYLDTLTMEEVDIVLKQVGIDNLAHRLLIKRRLGEGKEKYVQMISADDGRTLRSLVELKLKIRGVAITGENYSQNLVMVITKQNENILEEDNVLEEILLAQENGVRVIALAEESAELSDEIIDLVEGRVVRWVHDYQEAAVDRLDSLLRLESWREPTLKLCRRRTESIDSGIELLI